MHRTSQVLDVPISGVDVLPSFCHVAGIAPPRSLNLDGASFIGALGGRPILRNKPLYWQFHAARGEDQVAVIKDNWKLIGQFEGGSLPPHGDIFAEHQERIHNAEITRYQLFDLSVDETTDVRQENASIAAPLENYMQRIFKSVQADNPTWSAWTWPREEGKQIRAYVDSLKAK